MNLPELIDDLEPAEIVGALRPDDRVLVFSIHDGDRFPLRLLGEQGEALREHPDVARKFVCERDWGANLVAEGLVRELALAGYLRVNLARVLVDYGRFPGVTGRGPDYLHRKSVYPPMSDLLPPETCHTLIRHYYDAISALLTQTFAQMNVTLGVHTYDPYNGSGTLRPEVSLVTRSLSYQWESKIPAGIFDPLFPAILCESVANKALTFRMVLDLEESGRDVALNHPYVMPEGSVEIRAQVWFFFCFLRRKFTDTYPETRSLPEYQRVWQMLLDVTRRSIDCELLRGYLHRFRDAPAHMEQLYAACRRAYQRIGRFLAENESELVDRYRISSERPSTLGIEVRKDLLYEIDHEKLEARPRPDAERVARDVARVMAGAVRAYLDQRQKRGRESLPPTPAEMLSDRAVE